MIISYRDARIKKQDLDKAAHNRKTNCTHSAQNKILANNVLFFIYVAVAESQHKHPQTHAHKANKRKMIIIMLRFQNV